MSIYEIKRKYYERSEEERLSLYKETLSEEIDSKFLLSLAVEFSDVNALSFLLDNGLSLNQLQEDGKTALHICARGYAENCELLPEKAVYDMVRYLVNQKVSVMRKDESMKTCYHIAVDAGAHEFIQALNDANIKITMSDREGNTSLHIACYAVRHAIRSLEYAKERLENFYIKYEEEKLKFTEDTVQVYKDSFIDTQKSLEANLVVQQNKVDSYEKTVIALLESDIDSDEKNNYQQTALMFAIESKAKRIAALIEGVDLNDEDAELQLAAGGMTLHQAVAQNDIEAIEAICKLGVDVNQIGDEAGEFLGRTPLAIAVIMSNPDSVKKLLSLGADPNFRDSDGKQAIAYSFTTQAQLKFNPKGYEEKVIPMIIDTLIQYGWEKDSFVDDDSNTVLTLASRRLGMASGYNGHFFEEEYINHLLALEADLEIKNKDGQTAIMFLVGDDPSRTENCAIQMLEQGVNIEVKDAFGNTPLIYASRNRNHSAAKNFAELLDQCGNIQISEVNNEEKSALDYATELNNEPLVKWLLMKM